MKLGISTACFYGNQHVEDSFPLIAKAGADVAEVFLNTDSEYDEDFAKKLVTIKDNENIKIHSLHAHGTTFEPELFSDYGRIRDDAEIVLKKVLRAGYLLGAKYYTFHGPFTKNGRPEKINYQRYASIINRLCDIAEDYGMMLAYENVNWCRFSVPEFFGKLKDECPKLRATFDVKQAVFSDIDPYRFLEVMGDRLVTVHLCDMTKDKKPCMPFYGDVDFAKLLQTINKINPDAGVMLEVYSTAFKEINELKDCFAKLKIMQESL